MSKNILADERNRRIARKACFAAIENAHKTDIRDCCNSFEYLTQHRARKKRFVTKNIRVVHKASMEMPENKC